MPPTMGCLMSAKPRVEIHTAGVCGGRGPPPRQGHPGSLSLWSLLGWGLGHIPRCLVDRHTDPLPSPWAARGVFSEAGQGWEGLEGGDPSGSAVRVLVALGRPVRPDVRKAQEIRGSLGSTVGVEWGPREPPTPRSPWLPLARPPWLSFQRPPLGRDTVTLIRVHPRGQGRVPCQRGFRRGCG